MKLYNTSLLALVTYEETTHYPPASSLISMLPFQEVSMAMGLQYYIDRPLTLHSSYTSDGIQEENKSLSPQVDV